MIAFHNFAQVVWGTFTEIGFPNQYGEIEMRKAIILTMTILLVACATSGTKFEMSAVNAMQPGVTTYDQAVANLGKPFSVNIAADGSKRVVWSWAQGSGLTEVQSRAVGILFDKDGKMVRVAGKAGTQID